MDSAGAGAGADRTAELAPVSARRPAYVESWKRIAQELERSERWCRTMAARAVDPLPVFKVGGVVRLLIADLDAWLDRQHGGATVSTSATVGGLQAEIAELRAEVRRLTALVLADHNGVGYDASWSALFAKAEALLLEDDHG